MLSLGLMSGTSMDGIDAALLETDGSAQLIRPLGHTLLSFEPQSRLLLKSAEYAVRQQAGNMQKARQHYPAALGEYLQKNLGMSEAAVRCQLSELACFLYAADRVPALDDVIQHSTELHAKAIRKLLWETGYAASRIDVIGYHGQTLFHSPAMKISVVVGHAQYLADQLGMTVVHDFRSRDIENGGQGAPLAPLYHQALAIRDKKMPVAVVNCGGIANMTLAGSDREADLIGFDTGPGNGLIDSFVRQRTQGRENMDTDGHYGIKGKVNGPVMKVLYEKSIVRAGQNYFRMPPPKSLDIGDMILVPELDLLSLEDACATLAVFTAETIIDSLAWVNTACAKYWILTGGGWRNPVIYQTLKEKLQARDASCQVLRADEAGWNSQAMEAQIFAWLAVRSLQNRPLSFPGTTGVSEAVSGGQTCFPSC